MDIAVTRFESADDPAALQAYEISTAAARADLPDLPGYSRHGFLSTITHPYPGTRLEWALATVAGEPAGYTQVELPFLDNTENASVDIIVHPAYRRRGVGRALHAYAARVAAENGRKRLAGFSVDTLAGGPARDPAPSAFARSVGAAAALTEVRRRLDVTSVDEAALGTALAKAYERADGYSLVQWRDSAPEDVIADVAYLDGRLLQDAPLGDLTWEPEKVDASRARAIEAVLQARRRRTHHTGARHDATGRLVAWTAMSLNDEPDWHCWQQITIVDPEHRGHRLGTIVKIENLRYVRAAEPALRYVDTFNAAVNDHMISINELMGFRPVDAWHNWQQDL